MGRHRTYPHGIDMTESLQKLHQHRRELAQMSRRAQKTTQRLERQIEQGEAECARLVQQLSEKEAA